MAFGDLKLNDVKVVVPKSDGRGGIKNVEMTWDEFVQSDVQMVRDVKKKVLDEHSDNLKNKKEE